MSRLISTLKQKFGHLELSHTSHQHLEMPIKMSQETLVQYAQALPNFLPIYFSSTQSHSSRSSRAENRISQIHILAHSSFKPHFVHLVSPSYFYAALSHPYTASLLTHGKWQHLPRAVLLQTEHQEMCVGTEEPAFPSSFLSISN